MKVIQSRRCRSIPDDGAVCVSLPEDVIFDVLVRLPLKALCRFRCVSKAWRALISNPGFAAAQRSHAGPLIVGVFGYSPYQLRVLDTHGDVLWVFEVKECAMLVPTRLDLICVDRMRLGAMIVDPAARRAFTVGGNVDRSYNFSFGRATPSGAYKVLRFYYETHATVCEVATITDDSAEPTWRQRPPPIAEFSAKHKATVNGVLYFMPYMTYRTTPVWNRVAGFDLESEVWLETINGPPLGPEVEQEEWDIDLSELKGALCMVHIHKIKYADIVVGWPRCYADVWHLIDYNKSVWVKMYTIQMPAECLHTQVLDVLDDSRILLLSLNRRRLRYFLQFFNPSTKAFTDIMEMVEGLKGGGKMTLYTGSLDKQLCGNII